MKEAYKHDYSGSCAPGKSDFIGYLTFSVGIFQWLPKSNGKGLKKSAVKYRIKGACSTPEKVYAAAQTVCAQMDHGWIPKTKSESV